MITPGVCWAGVGVCWHVGTGCPLQGHLVGKALLLLASDNEQYAFGKTAVFFEEPGGMI